MSALRIGIDGYNLALPNGTGVASYGFTLAETLRGAGHAIEGVFGIDAGTDPDLREVLFFDRLAHPPQLTPTQRARHRRGTWRRAILSLGHASAVRVPLTGRVETAALADRMPGFDRLVTAPALFELAYRWFRTSGRLLRLRMPDPPPIMHWTYPVPVTLAGSRNIYTIHDLVPLKLPYTTLDAKTYYRALLARCISGAAHICTVSEASRADIMAEFRADCHRVSNCWQAAPGALPTTSAQADAGAIEGVFGLRHRGYFLYFGAIEPKKNIGRLIEAYLSISTTTPLVLVSGGGWRSDPELGLVQQGDQARGGPDGRIVRLDRLPRSLLQKLIRGARAVAFPSLHEGFGLPVLEAMRLGTPVLTSNTSSLPEVAGPAALLVDPYDVEAIAAGLRALDEDEALRDRLAAAGGPQAGRFAPARYAERLETMYAAAMAARP